MILDNKVIRLSCNLVIGERITLSGSTKRYKVIDYCYIGKDEISLVLEKSNGDLIFLNRHKRYVECLDGIRYE